MTIKQLRSTKKRSSAVGKRKVWLSHKSKVQRVANKAVSQKTIRVFVAGGSRPGHNLEYAEAAFQLGQVIAKRNYQLTFGWSSRGIMGAVAQGVLSIWKYAKKNQKFKPMQGVTTERYQKLYPDDALWRDISDVIVAHSLEERKQSLLEADFVVFAAGGLGTLDELAYDCIAMQDGWLKSKPFIMFNVGGFFHHLLEYLKDIHLKGFSDRTPFIVVDDVFEMEVAFDMIAFYRSKMKNQKLAVQIVDKIIHELPYVIEQVQKDATINVGRLLKEKNDILKNAPFENKQALMREIETAYLNKEIQRMNERLVSTSRDTALVSRKLDELQQQMKKTRHTNGFY